MSKSKPSKTAKATTKKATKRTDQMKPEAGNLVDDLRQAIATSELSRYEIAKRAEISASLLSVFVNGQRSLTLDTAAKVATVLGLVLKPK